MNNWSTIQSKALIRWINFVNNESVVSVTSLSSVNLIELLENLSGTKCPYKYEKIPKTNFARIEGFDCVIQFAKSLNVRIVGIDGFDLSVGNEKTFLALITGILNRFIGLSSKEVRLIHQWIATLVGQPIRSMREWATIPILGKLSKCQEHPLERLEKLGVPMLVDEEDLGKEELSMNIYLVYLYEKRKEIEALNKEMIIDLTGDKKVVEETVEELKQIKSGIIPKGIEEIKDINENELAVVNEIELSEDDDSTSTFSSSELDSGFVSPMVSVTREIPTNNCVELIALEALKKEESFKHEVVEPDFELKEVENNLEYINKEESTEEDDEQLESQSNEIENIEKDSSTNITHIVSNNTEESILENNQSDNIINNCVDEKCTEKDKLIHEEEQIIPNFQNQLINDESNVFEQKKEKDAVLEQDNVIENKQIIENNNQSKNDIETEQQTTEIINQSIFTLSEQKQNKKEISSLIEVNKVLDESQDELNENKIVVKAHPTTEPIIIEPNPSIESSQKRRINKIEFYKPTQLSYSYQEKSFIDSPRKRGTSLSSISQQTENNSIELSPKEIEKEGILFTPRYYGKFKAADALSKISRQRSNTSNKKDVVPILVVPPQPSNTSLVEEVMLDQDRLFKMETENRIRRENDLARIRTFKEKKSEYMRCVDSDYLIKSYLDDFKKWTGKSQYQVIYDSAKDEFPIEFTGLTNIMILLVGKRLNIFGWYNTKKIPSYGFIKNDPGHFVFTLQNPFNIAPTPFYPIKKKCKSCAIHPDEHIFISLKKTMNVIKKGRVFVVEMGMKFSQRYTDPSLAGDTLFIKDENVMEKVLVVQWM
ncbi:hypothetical protein ENUP19_0099G0029 [Entamoeba nuttalli]|uniref:Calponin homology (Ch) domain containing protein n=2 Tax=Entamoeba nuttalli TaxID=412467 RepID=K2H0Q8_ENTNP|nr:calponin homology (ch) domain containing protein [Entamoeba nuttalli P19]EKE39837.1 calponin homology (ch) domain containing protein [Entamoeba nuttalli P19]|eukprot:XP_008857838.1 calponin homology (ch) domain containing protein [Entamoeba nuttalli P19]